jgi:hypothetical protein
MARNFFSSVICAMKVLFTKSYSDHVIEIGSSTWDPNEISVRIRRNLPNGKFNKAGSPKVPLARLPEIVSAVGILSSVITRKSGLSSSNRDWFAFRHDDRCALL